MERYERDARHHADRIRHYFDHAGETGHSQANYHYDQLSNWATKVPRSKNDKNDVMVIQLLREEADPLMDEMKKREEQATQKGDGSKA